MKKKKSKKIILFFLLFCGFFPPNKIVWVEESPTRERVRLTTTTQSEFFCVVCCWCWCSRERSSSSTIVQHTTVFLMKRTLILLRAKTAFFVCSTSRHATTRAYVFGELISTRIFCRCAFERHHSFIHSFFHLPHKYICVICALLEEGGKEDGDDDFDDAREQQHA